MSTLSLLPIGNVSSKRCARCRARAQLKSPSQGRTTGAPAELPVLDMTSFRQAPNSSGGRAFVHDLLAAAHGPGFVYLAGHGVERQLDADLFAVSREFFNLPEAQRRELAIANSAAFRGYTVLGDERTNGASDWRHQLDFGPEQPAPVMRPGDPAWLKLRGPNQWPPGLPHMKATVLPWMAAMEGVGLTVLRALALGLGQPLSHFDSGFLPHSDVHLKLMQYPACPEGDSGQGLGKHVDTGLLSFILQDEVGGLQVQLGDEMVDAPRVEGAYIMNLGEMMQTASDGYLRATPHRVESPPVGRERLSVGFFFNPRYEMEFPPIELPPELAAVAPGIANVPSDDALSTHFGENNLKTRLRSHPDVAAAHYSDM